LPRKKLSPERRKWQRLPLAVPVFIRCSDKEGKDVLEFATAVNLSAGGMLVALRRVLPEAEHYSLEIPSGPIPDDKLSGLSSRSLKGHPVRVAHGPDYHLLGLKFSRALVP
jgi:hypothetical protein